MGGVAVETEERAGGAPGGPELVLGIAVVEDEDGAGFDEGAEGPHGGIGPCVDLEERLDSGLSIEDGDGAAHFDEAFAVPAHHDLGGATGGDIEEAHGEGIEELVGDDGADWRGSDGRGSPHPCVDRCRGRWARWRRSGARRGRRGRGPRPRARMAAARPRRRGSKTVNCVGLPRPCQRLCNQAATDQPNMGWIWGLVRKSPAGPMRPGLR